MEQLLSFIQDVGFPIVVTFICCIVWRRSWMTLSIRFKPSPNGCGWKL